MKIVCADKDFGHGCDFAKILSSKRVELFEMKTCTLSLSDASRAIEELRATKSDLISKGMVNDGCIFQMFIIHVKKGHCRTDIFASMLLQSKSIGVLRADDEEVSQLLSQLLEVCKDS